MNYLDLMKKHYPDYTVVEFGGSTYESIKWYNDEAPVGISKTVVDALLFKEYQLAATAILSDTCELTIMSGFTSDALGSLHRYASGELDQINLIGAIIASEPNVIYPAGNSIPYKCADIVDGVIGKFVYQTHTPEQMYTVFMAGVMYKQQQLTKYHTKEYYINQCTTTEQVDAITWTSTP